MAPIGFWRRTSLRIRILLEKRCGGYSASPVPAPVVNLGPIRSAADGYGFGGDERPGIRRFCDCVKNLPGTIEWVAYLRGVLAAVTRRLTNL